MFTTRIRILRIGILVVLAFTRCALANVVVTLHDDSPVYVGEVFSVQAQDENIIFASSVEWYFDICGSGWVRQANISGLDWINAWINVSATLQIKCRVTYISGSFTEDSITITPSTNFTALTPTADLNVNIPFDPMAGVNYEFHFPVRHNGVATDKFESADVSAYAQERIIDAGGDSGWLGTSTADPYFYLDIPMSDILDTKNTIVLGGDWDAVPDGTVIHEFQQMLRIRIATCSDFVTVNLGSWTFQRVKVDDNTILFREKP